MSAPTTKCQSATVLSDLLDAVDRASGDFSALRHLLAAVANADTLEEAWALAHIAEEFAGTRADNMGHEAASARIVDAQLREALQACSPEGALLKEDAP